MAVRQHALHPRRPVAGPQSPPPPRIHTNTSWQCRTAHTCAVAQAHKIVEHKWSPVRAVMPKQLRGVCPAAAVERGMAQQQRKHGVP